MLKNWLLTTTFLILAGSVFFSPGEAGENSAGQPRGVAMSAVGGAGDRVSAIQTRMSFGNPGRDRNRDFLCTYGYDVYYRYHIYDSWSSIYWQHYAVPIKGRGTLVREIVVTDEPYSHTYSSSFNVGIYSSANGHPGSLIAGGSGIAKGSCRRTEVVIPKTLLTAGKKYWVVEDAPPHNKGGRFNEVIWGYKSNATRENALYQTFFSSAFSSSLSDWLPVNGPAPFVNVK